MRQSLPAFRTIEQSSLFRVNDFTLRDRADPVYHRWIFDYDERDIRKIKSRQINDQGNGDWDFDRARGFCDRSDIFVVDWK